MHEFRDLPTDLPRDLETGCAISMSRTGYVWQFDSQNEVLSLMFKAYILSLVLVLIVLVWCANDAWVQYAEFCYVTRSLIMGANYTSF